MQILTLFAAAVPIAVFLFALYVASAVQHDAACRRHGGSDVFLLGHWGWFFVVLLSGGLPGLVAYWAIHYSALRQSRGGLISSATNEE